MMSRRIRFVGIGHTSMAMQAASMEAVVIDNGYPILVNFYIQGDAGYLDCFVGVRLLKNIDDPIARRNGDFVPDRANSWFTARFGIFITLRLILRVRRGHLFNRNDGPQKVEGDGFGGAFVIITDDVDGFRPGRVIEFDGKAGVGLGGFEGLVGLTVVDD